MSEEVLADLSCTDKQPRTVSVMIKGKSPLISIKHIIEAARMFTLNEDVPFKPGGGWYELWSALQKNHVVSVVGVVNQG